MHYKRFKAQAGLTLIEMIVVVAIVAVVSTVLIFNYSGFSTNVSIRNLAEEMALAIRKAQTYATSVQAINSGSSNILYPAYGISFSTANVSSDTTAPSVKRFVLFADTNTDKIYTTNGVCGAVSNGSSECVESFGITTADKIVSLTTKEQGSVPGPVNVIFTRPAPDAVICVVSGGSCSYASNLDIKVQSAKGITRTVSIWNTGQISVK